MLAAKAKTQGNLPKTVLAKARRGNVTSLGHAGGAIRLVARRSIRRSKKEAPAGEPPRTRRGQLRGGIVYAVEPQHQRVLIGPKHSSVGESGSAHERGGRYRKQDYPRRPFMGPALEKTKDRLPPLWAGSVR